MKTKLKSILAVALCAVGLAAFAEPDAVQLWEGGPYFATCNVGAKTPQEYGYYFWWGDTVGYTQNVAKTGWVSVKDGTSIKFSNESPANTLYGADAAALADYVDANRNLKSDYDAATAHMGAPWRMMTIDELNKLVSTEYCQRKWVNEYKGVPVSGYVVKGKAGSEYENNEVFFPAAGTGDGSSLSDTASRGRYWSSSACNSQSAWILLFNSGEFYANGRNQYSGLSVRAVRDTPPEPPPPEGSEGNPWKVGGTDGTGDLVEAWTNGTGVLTVQGAGSVTNLADVIADWTDIKGGITAINVASNGVTGAMAQAFAGLGDPTPVALTLPDGWQGELPDGGNWYGAKVTLTAMPLTVRNVRARQRWPWNGKVDVLCDMTGPAGAKDAIVTVKDGEKALTNFTAQVTIPEGGVLATNFVWDAMTAGLAANFKSDDVTVEVAIAGGGADPTAPVQLWKNGPYFATCNVGATKPGDYGELYTFNGNKAADAAASLGDGWRLPTKTELEGLLANCTKKWETCQDSTGAAINGYRFTGTGEYSSNSIFLPAAGIDSDSRRDEAGASGYYWSSEAKNFNFAYDLFLDGDDAAVQDDDRGFGISVRAVRDTK